MPDKFTFPAKDPQETLDYVFDWTDALDGDTITGTPTWTIPSGITSSNPSNTTTTATIYLAGGTEGSSYDIKCNITTTGGRTFERTVTVPILNK